MRSIFVVALLCLLLVTTSSAQGIQAFQINQTYRDALVTVGETISGDIDFGGYTGVGLTAPTTSGEIVNKGYVDALSIDDLTDVDTATSSPVTSDVLRWDGSNWVSKKLVSYQIVKDTTLRTTTSNTYVDLAGATLTLSETGVYEFYFILQFTNTNKDVAVKAILNINGTDVPVTEMGLGVPKEAPRPGFLVVYSIESVTASQVAKIRWKTEAGTLSSLNYIFTAKRLQ